jgi:hypothetical protein
VGGCPATVHRRAHSPHRFGEPLEHRLADEEMADVEFDDLGQAGNPLHPDGLAAFFAGMRKEGFSQGEIDLMSKTNPAKVLGMK